MNTEREREIDRERERERERKKKTVIKSKHGFNCGTQIEYNKMTEMEGIISKVPLL